MKGRSNSWSRLTDYLETAVFLETGHYSCAWSAEARNKRFLNLYLLYRQRHLCMRLSVGAQQTTSVGICV